MTRSTKELNEKLSAAERDVNHLLAINRNLQGVFIELLNRLDQGRRVGRGRLRRLCEEALPAGEPDGVLMGLQAVVDTPPAPSGTTTRHWREEPPWRVATPPRDGSVFFATTLGSDDVIAACWRIPVQASGWGPTGTTWCTPDGSRVLEEPFSWRPDLT
jgi:hypothetical protein